MTKSQKRDGVPRQLWRGLYPIVDADTLDHLGLDPIEFARQVLAARPAMLQLRAKRTSDRATLELLQTLLPLCRAQDTLLLANDRPDLALLAGAPGVHLGQDDLPLGLVRQLGPELVVGISTHSLAEIEAACREAPDYVAFGPVFPTTSKEDPGAARGVDLLEAAYRVARAHHVPLVAIGGITCANITEVRGRADLAAVISALHPRAESGRAPSPEDSAKAARALQEMLV